MKRIVPIFILLAVTTFGLGEANNCPKLPNVEHGSFEFYEHNGWPSQVCRVIYQCDPGFTLVGDHDLYCYLGKWSGNPPMCVVTRCGALPDLENGNVRFVGMVPAYLKFSVAEYNCNDGYEMVGKDYSRVCLPGGQWSGSTPECVEVACDFSDVTCEEISDSFENGDVSCSDSNNYQSVCKFACDDSFDIDGVAEVTCQAGDGEHGKWSDAQPICRKTPDTEEEIVLIEKDPSLLQPVLVNTTGIELTGELEEDVAAVTSNVKYLDVENEIDEFKTNSILTPFQLLSAANKTHGVVGDCPRGSDWTPWHNRDRPSGTGDWEVRNLYLPRGTCAHKNPSGIQARLARSHQPFHQGGDVLYISPSRGLVCKNSDQSSGSCQDYEIRFCCAPDYNDGIVGDCPNDGVWTSWHNRDHPSGTGDWEVKSLYQPRSTCVDSRIPPLAIQARLVGSHQPYQAGGDVVSVNPSLGFVCKNSNQDDKMCNDYEVRYCCRRSDNNGVVGSCPRGGVWTSWHSRDLPSGTGDWEVRSLYQPSGTCADGDTPPHAIQARLVGSHQPYQAGGDVVSVNPTLGLVCKNSNQDDKVCNNYEVRYCCHEDTENEVIQIEENPSLLEVAVINTDGIDLSGELESDVVSVESSVEYLDVENEIDEFKTNSSLTPFQLSSGANKTHGVVGDCPRGSDWTPWHNRDRPSGTGDWEVRNLYLPRGTCAHKNPSGIQARLARTQQPFHQGGDVLYISPSSGLICKNSDQSSGSCQDYEVRYCCAPDYNDGIVGSCPKDGVWTSWHNRDLPSGTGDWEVKSLYQPRSTCVDDDIPPLAIQARLVGTNQPYQAGGDVVSVNPSLGFVCKNSNQDDRMCNNYEVRYCCRKSDNNGVVGSCPRGGVWTSWHSRDLPSGTGDWEVRSLYQPSGTCADGDTPPHAIQARLVGSHQPYQAGGDVVSVNPSLGLVCKNSNQDDKVCNNYEVRYCCQTVSPLPIVVAESHSVLAETSRNRKRRDIKNKCDEC